MVMRKKPGEEVADYLMQDIEGNESPKKKKKLDPKIVEELAAGRAPSIKPEKEAVSSLDSIEQQADITARQAGVDPDLARESAKAKLEEKTGQSLDDSSPEVQKKIAEEMVKNAGSLSNQMTPEQADELVAKSKEDDSGANMPAQRSDAPGGQGKPTEEKPPEEEEEESMWGWSNFKNALQYFGPRMGALLAGGPGALELTEDYLKGFEGGQGVSPAQQARLAMEQQKLDLSRERLDLAKSESQRKGSQFQESMELQRQRAATPSQKFLETIAAKETVINQTARVKKLLEDVNPGKLGILAGKSWGAVVKLGKKDDEFVKFQQGSNKLLIDYVKSVSGQQVSDKEAARIGKVLWDVDLPYNVIKARMEGFEEMLHEDYDTYKKTFASGAPLTKEAIKNLANTFATRLDERAADKNKKKDKNNSNKSKSMSLNDFGLN